MEKTMCVNSHSQKNKIFINETPQKFGGVSLASEVTTYTPATIYKMCSLRQIPFFKRNGKLIFSRENLERWLTENPVDTIDDEALRKSNQKKISTKRKLSIKSK
jgi:hypothetical protein